MKIIFYLIFSVNIFAEDIILLLGGINRPNATYMNKIKESLSQEGRRIIDDINVETFKHSISEQAESVYDDLIKNKNVTAQDRIIIIGHSQGGLRGYKLYEKHKNDLNILALFTISTPWRGAGILDRLDEIGERVNRIYKILNTSGWGYDTLRDKICEKHKIIRPVLKKYISNLLDFRKFIDNAKVGHGTLNMKQNSLFINGLNIETKIPIFNIVGTEIDIFDIIAPQFFNDAQKALDAGKSEAIKKYEILTPSFAVPAAALSTVALFPIIGPFSFLVGAWLAPVATTATVHGNRDELLDDLNYLKSSIDFFKNFNVNPAHPKKSDLILSLEEQTLPVIISDFYISKGFYKKLGSQQQFEIQGSLHDILPIKDEERFEEIQSKIIYNNQEVLDILNQKIDILFAEEEQ